MIFMQTVALDKEHPRQEGWDQLERREHNQGKQMSVKVEELAQAII